MKTRALITALTLAIAPLALIGCNTTQGPGGATNSANASTTTGTSTGGGLSALSSGLSSVASVAGSGTAGSKGNLLGAGADLLQAVTISDADIRNNSLAMMKGEDSKNKVPANSDKFAQRLARLTAKHLNEDGLNLNFKVYLSNNVNAFAAPDGSIRFYAGLMNLMNDQELLAVIGHEIGHVKFEHSKNGMRTELMASAARKGLSSKSGAIGVLAASDFAGGFAEKIINAQHSQSQETESDDYAIAFMKRHRYSVPAVESALRKLATGNKAGGVMDSLLSSHPDPAGRAERAKKKAQQ